MKIKILPGSKVTKKFNKIIFYFLIENKKNQVHKRAFKLK